MWDYVQARADIAHHIPLGTPVNAQATARARENLPPTKTEGHRQRWPAVREAASRKSLAQSECGRLIRFFLNYKLSVARASVLDGTGVA